MDQTGPYPPPPPYPPGYVYPPPRPAPQVVHIVARPGGFARAFGFAFGLCFIGAVFAVGIFVGLAIMLNASQMKAVVLEESYREGPNDSAKIGIIAVEGVIDSRQAELIRTLADHVLDDSSYRAVVLRVESPGGMVAPSDQIWYEVGRIRAKMPVVASYGGVAASGGYYVSCAASRILAEETCITGSIGVVAQTFAINELMGKIGIQPITVVSTHSPNKDVGNPFRPWEQRDQQFFTHMLDSAYAIFVQRVAEGRKAVITDRARVSALADGSVFTAREAMENGLIDGIGYLDDAVAAAEQAVGMGAGQATVVRLRPPPTLFNALGGGVSAMSRSTSLNALDSPAIRRVANELASPQIMYLMP